jgi:hypothetical protein
MEDSLGREGNRSDFDSSHTVGMETTSGPRGGRRAWHEARILATKTTAFAKSYREVFCSEVLNLMKFTF